MPTATGYRITKIGAFAGAEPRGRLWIIAPSEDASTEVVCSIDTTTGASLWDVALRAFADSRPIEAVAPSGSGTLASPYPVSQIRITA